MNSTPKLDRIDIRILSHLQRNGRISNVDLADAVGLPPSPCLTRVNRPE
jgi:DNA-binding Lrp family transcriptional regulator